MNKRMIKLAHLVALCGLSLALIAFLAAQGLGGIQQSNNNNGSSTAGQNSNANTGGAVSSSDRQFMMKAAMSGMEEVEMSRLAAQHAASDAVKQFAQRMIDDHTRANTELMQLAASKGVTLPTAPDAKLQAELAKMGALNGADFDRSYIREAGVKEHEKAAKLMQRASTGAADTDLRAFAAKTLPVVQEHLTMARSMSTGMGHGGHGGHSGNMNSSGGGNSNASGGNSNKL
jgi:putative membrane protein